MATLPNYLSFPLKVNATENTPSINLPQTLYLTFTPFHKHKPGPNSE